MTRPIEAVLAEAQRRLESTGRLDTAAFVAAYPEHADELAELLPVMLRIQQEKRWQQAELQSRTFAVSLFSQLTEQGAAVPAEASTLGSLFLRERQEAGLSLEEQSHRSGLPVSTLEQLTRDETPLSRLDNTAIKQVANKLSAPFSALIKEVRRLTSLDSLSGGNDGGLIFTRDSQTSTDEERKALLDKVREAARKPPKQQ